MTEIVETEEKYGRDLQIILEEFYKPMLVAGLLTQEQLSAIFLNVEELIENNQVMSEKLRDALEIAIEQGDEVRFFCLFFVCLTDIGYNVSQKNAHVPNVCVPFGT